MQWRWRGLPQSVCYRLSEWLSLRSEGFDFQQLHLLQAPLGSRRQRPFLRLLSLWRCLRYWTGCCCDCSPLHCCWSRWVILSVAVGYWAWMMGHHLSPVLRMDTKTSRQCLTFIVALLWHSPLLCWRVGEVTLRMQGVSWPSLSCEESLERSLERRRSRECSQPPLAPYRLIFLCSASTRDARAWLLLFKTEEDRTFVSVSMGQWTVVEKRNLQIWHIIHDYLLTTKAKWNNITMDSEQWRLDFF